MKFDPKKRAGSPIPVCIAALFLLFTACTPKAAEIPPAERPLSAGGISAEEGKTAPEELLRVSRAFGEAGLPVLRQRVPSPDFSASPAKLDRDSVTLANLKGKVVFLNFWATWCGPCRAEMPSMEALYQRYKEKGLEIVAVNYLENPKTVESFAEKFSLSFPITLDPSGRINGLYEVQAFPTTYIIDREGKIVTRVVGSLDWNTPELFAAFEALLDS
ncbi:MAG: TlpA family protein disulfide reductase [Treponema sp.]|jgi:thiol-disulfide isomerase/thioredoxin|nr:TlpA family protein disulfide reductase [Treponema sp.]